MNKNIGYGEDISVLLYEITDVYEKEIKKLKEENRRLQHLLSTNVLFRVDNKFRCVWQRLKFNIQTGMKNIIISLGMKETVKNSKLYSYIKLYGKR